VPAASRWASAKGIAGISAGTTGSRRSVQLERELAVPRRKHLERRLGQLRGAGAVGLALATPRTDTCLEPHSRTHRTDLAAEIDRTMSMVATTAVASPQPPVLAMRVAPGHQRRTSLVREPAGVVLLTRLVVPHGAVAGVTAVIPGVAGVGVDTLDEPGGANRCRRSRPVDVCTRYQEWCPMPAARWRVTLVKRAGPAGVIRFLFRVGAPPVETG
jgi:hypothetical protein